MPIELEDTEEKLLCLGFNLCLEFQLGFGSVLRQVNYIILKDFCEQYELNSLELLGLYKEMIIAMEV